VGINLLFPLWETLLGVLTTVIPSLGDSLGVLFTVIPSLGGSRVGVIHRYSLSGRLPGWGIIPLFPLWEAPRVGIIPVIPSLGGSPGRVYSLLMSRKVSPGWVYSLFYTRQVSPGVGYSPFYARKVSPQGGLFLPFMPKRCPQGGYISPFNAQKVSPGWVYLPICLPGIPGRCTSLLYAPQVSPVGVHPASLGTCRSCRHQADGTVHGSAGSSERRVVPERVPSEKLPKPVNNGRFSQ